MSRLRVSCLVACIAAMSFAGVSLGDDPKASPATQPSAADQAAMMAAWMKAATPGPEHAAMAKAVGEWNAEMTDMTTGTPGGDKSTGTAKISMIMDGRYMMEEFSGTTMGMPINGMMLMGYDNTLKEYTSIWIDSMGTGVAIAHGKMANGVLELKGSMVDPMSGKTIDTRQTLTHDGTDKTTLEMFMPGPGGKEMKAFSILYTRKK